MNILIKLLKEYQKENAYIFEFFKLYLDGSYGQPDVAYLIRKNIGEQLHNIAVGKRVKSSERRLKSQCISAFLKAVQTEFVLNRYKVNKAIFTAFEYSKETPEKLNEFNDWLVAEVTEYMGYSEII